MMFFILFNLQELTTVSLIDCTEYEKKHANVGITVMDDLDAVAPPLVGSDGPADGSERRSGGRGG
jgi:hypothetical protein